jgi:hypothetical protein
MVLLNPRKPAFPAKLATYTARCGGQLFNTTSSFSVRLNSTSVLTETKDKPGAKATLAPLSALPASVLCRSLLVAAISSKPYLLHPSLSILSFLCKPRRGFLLNVDRNPVLHGILKSIFYKQFCAGENKDEVKSTIRHFKDMGFQGTIMTYAKETVFDHQTKAQHGLGISQSVKQDAAVNAFCPHIEAWRKGTLETVELLGGTDYLAVK